MPTAELIINIDEFRPTLRVDQDGWVYTEHWKVDTSDQFEALFAEGLPQRGTKKRHRRAPDGLICRSLEPHLWTAREDGAGTAGFCRVQCEYRTETRGSIRPTANSVEEQWTQENIGRSQYQIFKPYARTQVGPGGGPGQVIEAAIRDGEGASVDVGTVELRVFTHLTPSQDVPLQRLLDLMSPNKLNEEAITLPPLYGATNRIRCERGQLKYTGFERSIVGEFQQLVHVLQLQRDFDVVWQPNDEKGQPLATTVRDRVYDFASFTGLWRT